MWAKTTLEVDHPRFVPGSFELILPDQPVIQVEVILGTANPVAVIIEADKPVAPGGGGAGRAGGADLGSEGIVRSQGIVPTGGCPLDCPAGSVQENPVQGCPVDGDDPMADPNGGCNSVPISFDVAACGDTVCGQAGTYVPAAGGSFRDTDWYLVDHPGGTLTGTLTSQFPGVCVIVDVGGGDCSVIAVVGVPGSSNNCVNTGVASADLPAGTYAVVVHPEFFDGIPCGGGNNDYVLEINCEGEPPVPPENDDCLNAIPIAVPSFTSGTTINANIDSTFPFCVTSITSPGVWYSVMGTGTTITATTCTNLFGYDTKISVYCGSCETPTCVTGNDDNCDDGASGLLSRVSWCSQVGAEYLILVHGFGGQTGDFELDVFDHGMGCNADVQCLPAGACCLSDDSCIVTTEAGCAAEGGVYEGDGSICSGLVYPGFSDCANPFEDISGTGIEAHNASNSDDAGDIVPIGFTFNFYGDDHTNIGLTSNGYLTFGADLTDFSNDAIPDPNDPNDVIAPLWDDFAPNNGGTVHYETKGNPPNQRFIAQWTNVPQFDTDDSNTFQAILFEGSNCIEFRYGVFTREDPAGDYTIGIENQDGSDGASIPGAAVFPGDCKVICQEVLKNPCVPSCPWDLDGSGVVGVSDFLELLGNWGPCPPKGDCPADFNGSGDVGVSDFLELLGNWGPCP